MKPGDLFAADGYVWRASSAPWDAGGGVGKVLKARRLDWRGVGEPPQVVQLCQKQFDIAVNEISAIAERAHYDALPGEVADVLEVDGVALTVPLEAHSLAEAIEIMDRRLEIG